MDMSIKPWTKDEMAKQIAEYLPDGSIINLGIGMPTLIANWIPEGKEIVLHTENGMLGMGPEPKPGEEDPDLINAGNQRVTALPGASFFDHATSFAIIRGGHLDYCVLGAYQVAVNGDLANWSTGDKSVTPAPGGAMDLAVGAKHIFVMMNLFTKQGGSKLVKDCTYPLTGRGCVKRIYSDHATFALTPEGVKVLALAPGVTLEWLQEKVGIPLSMADAAE